ncbi:ssDNA endonuclease and repair protein rad10 [Tilletia horrida]|nr:ssDNA endonuclease and repair protein rad10 [Tilletia horrida]
MDPESSSHNLERKVREFQVDKAQEIQSLSTPVRWVQTIMSDAHSGEKIHLPSAYDNRKATPSFNSFETLVGSMAISFLTIKSGLRYHRLHPEYIHTRIQKLAQMYALRILLIMCDVNDHQAAIKELTKVAVVNNLTIIVAWSAEEAGRYIETYKILEHKPVDVIKERISDDYMSQLTSVLTSIRGVNKTDVTTLLSNFGSLQRIATAAPSNLMMCPGFGDVKVRRLKEAFSQPFRAGETRTRAERISAGENLVGLKETIDPTEPRREGSPDEMLEVGPGDDFDSHGGLFDMDFFDDDLGAEPEPASQQPPPKRPRIQIGDI